MALTLSYSVTSINVKDEVNHEGVTHANCVCQTYWKVTGTDEEGNTSEWSGATPFSGHDVSAENYIDFTNLQESDVVSWISAVVEADPGYKAHILEQLERQIAQDKAREVSMPWAADDVTPTPDPGLGVPGEE